MIRFAGHDLDGETWVFICGHVDAGGTINLIVRNASDEAIQITCGQPHDDFDDGKMYHLHCLTDRLAELTDLPALCLGDGAERNKPDAAWVVFNESSLDAE